MDHSMGQRSNLNYFVTHGHHYQHIWQPFKLLSCELPRKAGTYSAIIAFCML